MSTAESKVYTASFLGRHSYSSSLDFSAHLLRNICYPDGPRTRRGPSRWCIGSCSDLDINYATQCFNSPLGKPVCDFSSFDGFEYTSFKNVLSPVFDVFSPVRKISANCSISCAEDWENNESGSYRLQKSLGEKLAPIGLSITPKGVKTETSVSEGHWDFIVSLESELNQYNDDFNSTEDTSEVFETHSMSGHCGSSNSKEHINECTPKHPSATRRSHLRKIMKEHLIPRKKTRARWLATTSIPNYMQRDCRTRSPNPNFDTSSSNSVNNYGSFSEKIKVRTSTPTSACSFENNRGDSIKTDSCYASYLDYVSFSRRMRNHGSSHFTAEEAIESSRNGADNSVEEMLEGNGSFGWCLQTFQTASCFPVKPTASLNKIYESVYTRNLCANEFGKNLETFSNRLLWDTDGFSAIEVHFPEGLLFMTFGIQSIPRPMSIKTKVLRTEDSFRLAKVNKSAARETESGSVEAEESSETQGSLAMGNVTGKPLATSRLFIPARQENPNYNIQRRRYGPREVHKNVWRLEKKVVTAKTPGRNNETDSSDDTRPKIPKRPTYTKNRSKYAKEREITCLNDKPATETPCATPNPDSLPSRSEALPPDGDSLRSDVEKNQATSERPPPVPAKCHQCTVGQMKLSKAYAQKGAVVVSLEKTQRELTICHVRIKELERELEETKKSSEENLANIRELETEMCHLQKEKTLLQHELNVTRKQLTRFMEQSDSSDSSHVNSVFVSGSQALDDGLGEDVLLDDDCDDEDIHRQLEDTKEQLSISNTECNRLKEFETRNEELETTIRHYEERIIELEEHLRDIARRARNTRESTTQTISADGHATFTRQLDKTKIPKRLSGHHSSLPVIAGPNSSGRRRPSTGSLTRLEALQRSLKIKDREISTLRKEMATLERELEKQEQQEDMQGNSQAMELKVENDRLLEELNIVKKNYQKETVMRKKYFNLAEDLKGKIRVFCRIKPRENQRVVPILEVPDEYTAILKTQRAKYEFTFDGVFVPDHSQDDVFKNVQNLVQSAVDGFNVCIFAYGQTGSGKTYTLLGTESHPGVSPKAFQKIFELVRENRTEMDFRISVSIFELYNERLIDLLRGDTNEDKLKIRRDHYGLVFVQGSESIEVKNEMQLLEVFSEACTNRHVGSTRMNMESSRSHLIISIRIESTNKITGTTLRGKLSIVDLAGSERVGKTAAAADQLKEANSINKSLSALGDVIAALSSEQQYVPYRNNKLTLLMQDSLGSNAKTLMFVTISSSDRNIEESLNSLTYASRVKQITNSATRMAESKEIARLKSIIMKLSKEEKRKAES